MKELRFLVTDIGNEDILFGYPWLAAYEPQFKWWDRTLNAKHLPITIHTMTANNLAAILAQLLSKEKDEITWQLDDQLKEEREQI
jgi:hypothetical protein